MKILCIGDSNTYGYDPRSYIGSRYPEDVRWTCRLGDHEVINCGLNGMTVPRSHQRQVGLIDLHEPDLVIVMLGTNDLLEGATAGTAAARMEAFLNRCNMPLILLVSPPPMKRGAWVPDDGLVEESKNLARQYEALAKRLGIRFADADEWDIELAYDGVHFTEEGHARFAGGLASCLEVIL